MSNSRFEEVGAVLLRNLPDSWKTAWVDAIISDDHAKLTYDYLDENDVEHWFDVEKMSDDSIVVDQLRAIRDEMFEQTGDKWKTVRFTIDKDMTFRTEFGYNDATVD